MRRISTALLLALALALALAVQAQDREEVNLLALINAYRGGSAVCWDGSGWRSLAPPALQLSAALTRAARSHTQVMIAQNCFAHVCSGEPDLAGRVLSAGYPKAWRFLAENLVAGPQTAQEAWEAWRTSEGHNRNMLACQARAIGISRLFGAQTQFGWYWTTVFGDIVEVDSPPPALKSFDVNGNDRLDNEEFFALIDAWLGGQLDDATFLRAIDLWVGQRRISG